MKTFRFSAHLALFALALSVGCGKSTDDKSGDGEGVAAASESAPSEDKAAAESPEAPALTDAVKRPPVAEKGTGEAAQEAADEGGEDPAARLDGPANRERKLVAIGATKTKIIPLGTKTLSDKKAYTLKLQLPDGAKKGADSQVKVELAPKKGWKINREFPTKLTVTPPSGVKVSKKSQGIGDAVEFDAHKGATWAVAFKASSAGKKDFTGKFKFAVCTETSCDPKWEKLAFSVNVK